jgi:Fe-Mn family superoxide dismutase
MTALPPTGIDRRDALSLLGAAGLGTIAAAAAGQTRGGAGTPFDSTAAFGWDAAKGEYTLPGLPYPADALEPHIDRPTMEIHHGKHHAAYVAGLNTALAELRKAREAAEYSLVKHWSRELAFHGGGHVNHCLFWWTMAPAGAGGGGEPAGRLGEAVSRDFGSFGAFSKHFQAAAAAVEGSGWAWLVVDRLSGRLMIQQMEKQQDMLVAAATPLLGCDVWEHAYYLRYQNKRADYVKAWFNVINWGTVGKIFEHARG